MSEIVTRREALEELAKRRARENLSSFVLYNHDDYIMGWFHREICRALKQFALDVIAKKSPRLIITAPPRSGKSQLVSRDFPAWFLGNYPESHIIASSYSSDLAGAMNTDVQRIIDGPRFRELFPFVFLASKEAAAKTGDTGAYKKTTDKFEIVHYRGSYRSAGVGGGITGMGADVLIIDDPHKDKAEAYSATMRSRVHDWYASTAYTRLAPGGGVIVMCTRWHPIKDDTPVLTVNGWKTHGELKPGDQVYGIDGHPVTVKAVTPPVWCDVAVDTGQEKIICSKTHLWAVKSRAEHNAVIYEAGALIGKKRILPRIKPLEFTQGAELPIDPYWLGLWLGDGNKNKPEIKCWHKHTEHCTNTVYKITRTDKDSHGDLFFGYYHQGLRGKLAELGLLGNKHIPDIYKYASIENRAALLAGLIDTDGDHSMNVLRFSSSNKELLEDVRFIVRSLGMRANGVEVVNRKGSKTVIGGKECTRRNDCYRFSFTPTMELPIKIPYKRCKIGGRERLAAFTLAAPEDQGWGRCISTTAPDGLYLVGRTLIPTHNTDDLVGHLLEKAAHGGDQYHVINYPAIAEHDEKYRKEGEALHPERYNLLALTAIKAQIGSELWAAMYQQHPVPEGGGTFKKAWIQYYKELPPFFDKKVLSWDMTFKDSKTSDYVVGSCWGRYQGSFYLIDQVRGRWDFVETLQRFCDFARKHNGVIRKLVEEKANGAAIISALKKQVTGLIPINPTESKEARASAIATLWEAHNVYIPSPEICPWVQDFTAELLSFPAGVHDDQVDSMTQALSDLQTGGRISADNMAALRVRR